MLNCTAITDSVTIRCRHPITLYDMGTRGDYNQTKKTSVLHRRPTMLLYKSSNNKTFCCEHIVKSIKIEGT